MSFWINLVTLGFVALLLLMMLAMLANVALIYQLMYRQRVGARKCWRIMKLSRSFLLQCLAGACFLLGSTITQRMLWEQSMIQAFTNSVQALLVVLGITGVSSVALVLLTFAVAEPTWSREMCLSEPWTSSHEKDDEGEDAGSLVVTEKGIGRVGWIALIVFSVVAGYYLWRGTYQAALVFVGMAVLGGISMLTAGSVEMDAEKVIHTNRLGRYGIEWSEVSYIEMHPRGAQVVLHGDDKRLVISGLRVWSGPDGGRMHSLLVAQVRQRQIEVNWTYSTPFRLSKKVRLDSP